VRAAVTRGHAEAGPAFAPLERIVAIVASALLAAFTVRAVGWFAGLLVSTLPVTLAVWWSRNAAAPAERPPLVRAAMLLRQLLGRTIVDAAGEVVLENTPHRAYLELRLAELGAARDETERRQAELAGTAARIRASNRRIGRPEDDAEVARLVDAQAEAARALDRLERARAALAGRLSDLDVQLDALRAHAERRALSSRAARLTDENEADEPLRTLADVEVDVAGIEAELSTLCLERHEHDARLGALLELLAPANGRRPG
jgi:hypothetical protein